MQNSHSHLLTPANDVQGMIVAEDLTDDLMVASDTSRDTKAGAASPTHSPALVSKSTAAPGTAEPSLDTVQVCLFWLILTRGVCMHHSCATCVKHELLS